MLIVYPGTFNPFHEGHRAVINAVRTHVDASAPLLVIPTGQPPHRCQADLEDPIHRLAMARLALHTVPNVQVSDVECSRPGPHYTALTLQQLNTWPVMMVVGRDALLSLPQWHLADWLVSHVHLLAINRDDQTLPTLPAFFDSCLSLRWIEQPVHPASATNIRQAIQKNVSLPPGWLHPDVGHYIKQHNLYAG
jgi:nicotinate-nucleotide adenylyltransferase